jgi:hypothetical protein
LVPVMKGAVFIFNNCVGRVERHYYFFSCEINC